MRPTAGTPLATGTLTVTGTATLSSVTSGTTGFGTLTEISGAATALVMLVQPSSAAITNRALLQQPNIGIVDQFTNLLSSANGNADDTTSVTASLNSGTAALSGTTAVTATDGVVAYTDLSFTTTGNKTLRFVRNPLNSTTSSIVAVTITNSPPSVSLAGTAISYLEGDATAMDSALTVTDADNSSLVGATVNISFNFVSGEDYLLFTDQNGITGSYDSTLGILTLNGSATVANYQAALRSILYTNASNNPSTNTRVLRVIVDDGAVADNQSSPVTRNLNVTPVNDAPTLDAPGNLAMDEDSPAQTVNLTGITSGGESQKLSVSATSSDTALIPHPTVTYSSPNTTGSLGFTPAANSYGTATITVTVMDNGGTANGGADTFSRTFTVIVNPVNDPPTLDTLANLTINEDTQTSVNFTGISAGINETGQTPWVVTASSSDPAVIPHPTVNYASASATGSLTFLPATNTLGTVTITVVASDSGGTSSGGVDSVTNTFTVAITAVNDAPTLNAIPNATLAEDAGTQTVSLAGISTGAANEAQTLAVTASSSDTGIIPHPSVIYTSPDSTGSLAYTPATNAHGTAKLTVDQRKETTPFNFVPLGEFTFKVGNAGYVEISNGKADGRVAIDGVRWVWLGEQ